MSAKAKPLNVKNLVDINRHTYKAIELNKEAEETCAFEITAV